MVKSPADKINSAFVPILWDYWISAMVFYRIALGQMPTIGLLNQQWALLRVFERMNWYDILDWFDPEFLNDHLTPELINNLRFPDARRKYGIIRKILHGEPISFPGWGVETHKRAQDAVLSNRWYCDKPALL
ncbi:MAG TPA: hypothetical protein PKI62_05020 [bacterium]|nr:hypothetical protein [bacterium]HPR87321.1 hypothetical protein [bacterium]